MPADKLAGALSTALKAGTRVMKGALPVVGGAMSVYSAGNHLAKGDPLGAAMDTGSLIASSTGLLPVSLGIEALGFMRDRQIEKEQEEKQNQLNQFTVNTKVAAASNFLQDLMRTQQGEPSNSQLYSSLAPLLQTAPANNPEDQARQDRLHGEVQKGLTGLEYLTGIKNNEGETFYDAHPAHAVALDAANHAPLVGGTLAAGTLALNHKRYAENLGKVGPRAMSVAGKATDAANPANLLDSGRADLASLFGDADSNLDKRLKLLAPHGGEALEQQHTTLSQRRAAADAAHSSAMQAADAELTQLKAQPGVTPKQIAAVESKRRAAQAMRDAEHGAIKSEMSDLVKQVKSHGGNSKLHKYVQFSESLGKGVANGGFSGYVGDKGGALGQALKDIMEAHHITGAHPNFDKKLVQDLVTHHLGGVSTPEQMKHFVSHTLGEAAHTNQGGMLRRLATRLKTPAKYGLGAAAGGMGLSYLLNSLAHASNSDDKITEWKANTLRSRNDFEGAQALEREQAERT